SKYASGIPTRNPRVPAPASGPKSSSLCRTDPASCGSKPDIAVSTAALSPTERVMGPTWSRVQDSGNTPVRPTRPIVGLSPTTPHSAARIRVQPTGTVPTAAYHRPAPPAAAGPLLDPPAIRPGSCGLPAGPVNESAP